MVRHNWVRTLSASGGSRRLMKMTPSIMSPTAAVNGLSERRTATTPPSLSRERLMLRLTPTMRGGLRNPGTTRSSSAARWANTLAAAVNFVVADGVIETYCQKGVAHSPLLRHSRDLSLLRRGYRTQPVATGRHFGTWRSH